MILQFLLLEFKLKINDQKCKAFINQNKNNQPKNLRINEIKINIEN